MAIPHAGQKHYLVTGGCGFIGSHLVDALIAKECRVTILDNLSTGKAENAHPEAALIIGDTTHYPTVEHALEGVDGCFHLAAVASVEKSVVDWANTHSVNVTSTVNIFQAVSRQSSGIPVVYTSSAAVYGDCPVMPISEEAPTVPLTAYGADKLGCDLHARVAWHVHGIRNIGLRPFNVYGPRQDPKSPYSGVISIFVDRMQRNLPVTIYGDGQQMRDFVYVHDVVKAFVAAMSCLHGAEGADGHQVINLCTGRTTSINQLFEVIAGTLARAAERQYAPARKGDIRLSIGDPARLNAQLGVTLDTQLQEGLQAMMPRADEYTAVAERASV